MNKIISAKYAVLTPTGVNKSRVSLILEGKIKMGTCKKFPEFKETRSVDYYYLDNIGPVDKDHWKDLLSSVIRLEKTFSEWCYDNNVPRSFARFLKTIPEFNEFISSREYRHLIGLKLSQQESTTRVNKKKTSRTRNVSTLLLERSYQRALSLCTKYNVTLLSSKDDWMGCHYSDGTIPVYDVSCNVCKTVYRTYFHSSTIRVCPACKDSMYRSIREEKFAKWLESQGFEVYRSCRTVLSNNWELDLYLPSLKIGIEFNGVYWHSSKYHDSDYHKNKTQDALSKGVTLLHFWEDESDASIEKHLKFVLSNKQKLLKKDLEVVFCDKFPDKQVLLLSNPEYKFVKWQPHYFLYLNEATFKHKSNTVCRDSSKFKDLLAEGFTKVYDSGVYIFKRS